MVSLKARAMRDPLATIVLLQNGFAMLLIAPFAVAVLGGAERRRSSAGSR